MIAGSIPRGPREKPFTFAAGLVSPEKSMNVTIECVDGGYSSAAERLTVAQDVVGSIPTSRPNDYK